MRRRKITVLIMLLMSGFILMPAVAEQSKPSMTLKQAMDLDKHNKFHEAVEAIKQIINQSPAQDNAKAYFSLGIVYFSNGEYENALDGGFLKSIELKKENPAAYYFMGMIYEKKALSTAKPDIAKEMKSKALESWQNYLKYAGNKKYIPSGDHNNIGITVQEGIKRAKNHIEMLQEGLQ